jgi:hypothetical protein
MAKPLTLGERRKAIRSARESLSLAILFTLPDNEFGHKRDMERSDGMIAHAEIILSNLRYEIHNRPKS